MSNHGISVGLPVTGHQQVSSHQSAAAKTSSQETQSGAETSHNRSSGPSTVVTISEAGKAAAARDSGHSHN